MIEDALRQTFAAQAEQAPPLAGVADAAIRRARFHRQRQTVSTVLAGFATLLVTGAVVIRFLPGTDVGRDMPIIGAPAGDQPSATARQLTSAVPGTVAGPLAMVGNEINSEGRQKLKLTLQPRSDERVSRVFRAEDGYLVITDSDVISGQQLYRLDIEGRQSVLLRAAQNIAVSSTGDQVAWRNDKLMSLAIRKGSQLVTQKNTPAPERGGPVAFLGDQVILGRQQSARSVADKGTPPPDAASPAVPGLAPVAGFDRWDPRGSGYSETWSDNVIRIFGAMPEGKRVIGQVLDAKTKEHCLAILVPAQPFAVDDTACGLPEPADVGGAISPDGRWLAYPTMYAAQVTLVDLEEVFDKSVVAESWSLDAPVRSLVWLDATTVVVDSGDRLARIDLSAPGQLQYVVPNVASKVLIEPLEG